MKSIALFICGCLGFPIAHAQTGTVTGKLMDTLHKKEPGLATVQIRKVTDSSLVTYRLSSPNGDFKVPGLPLNTALRLTVTYTGYLPLRKEFTISREKPVLDLGKLEMEITTKQLDEVIIRSEVPPVVMRNDTMEFNADAFKTLPEAVLQDLLKKIPGVAINSKGQLTANGKPVNKIMVDGKLFFGDDPSIALQNLPANVIDKVQVLDDKDQQEELHGEHEEQLGKIINIKLKRSVKKGLFGKVYAGGGTDERYEVGGILNSFRDTLQASVLAFTNNVNQQGFSSGDVKSMGGLDRGGNGSSLWDDSYMKVSGVDIGSADNGIRTIKAGGLNLNYDLGSKLSLNGKYFVSDNETRSAYISNSQQNIGDTVLSTNSTGSSVNTSLNNGFSFKVAGKRDSTVYWRYEPTIGFGSSDNWSTSQSATSNNFNPKLNDQQSTTQSHGTFANYGHTIGGGYNFKKKGRMLSFFQYLTTNSNKSRDTTHVASNYYLTDEHSVLDQYKYNSTGGTSMVNHLYYAEPLSSKSTVALSLNSEYNKNDNQLQTYNRDTVTHTLSALDPNYSNESHRESWQNSVELGYRLTLGKLRLSAYGELQQQNIHTSFGPRFAPVTQRITNILPSLSLSWKGLNMYYNKSVNMPGANNIQPLPDSSNPLNITIGNPNLRPTVQHDLAGYFQWVKEENSLSGYAGVRFTNHAVFSNRTVNAEGAQVTTFDNIDGQWGGYLGFDGRLKLHKTDHWNLYARAGMYSRMDKTFISVNGEHSGEVVYTASPRGGLDLNLHDVFDFSGNYSVDWSRSTFESKAYTAQETMVHTVSTTATLRLPKNFVWETSLVYRFNGALTPGISRNNYLWNTSASYLFGKDHRTQVKVSVFDLLNQHVNLSRGVHDNYVSDYQSTVLQRYGMLSLIYNIRGFRTK